MSAMMVCASAISPPPPRPWKPRASTSAVMLGASAQATEPSDENADRGEHHHAPAMDIGELAVERRHRRAGEQIGGHHPGQVVDIAEMPADGRQRGGDDGLVERAEEHRQHDAEHDGADFRMRERARLGQRFGLRRPRFCFGLASALLRLGLAERGCTRAPVWRARIWVSVLGGHCWDGGLSARWQFMLEQERLIAGNPLNALPVPAKQDAMMRGWYVPGRRAKRSRVCSALFVCAVRTRKVSALRCCTCPGCGAAQAISALFRRAMAQRCTLMRGRQPRNGPDLQRIIALRLC